MVRFYSIFIVLAMGFSKKVPQNLPFQGLLGCIMDASAPSGVAATSMLRRRFVGFWVPNEVPNWFGPILFVLGLPLDAALSTKWPILWQKIN